MTRASSSSITRPMAGWTPPRCSRRSSVPSAQRRAAPRLGARDRRRAHQRRIRPALTHRGDRRVVGQGGHLPDLFVLAVSALAIIDEEQRARDLLEERRIRISSPLGLYAEEFDRETGHHLGSFPQAFSHLAMIEAAGRLILSERLAEL